MCQNAPPQYFSKFPLPTTLKSRLSPCFFEFRKYYIQLFFKIAMWKSFFSWNSHCHTSFHFFVIVARLSCPFFFWKTKKTPGGRKFPLTCCHFFIFSFEINDDHSSVFFIFKKVLENHTKKWNKNWFYVCSGGVFFLTKMENCAENMHYWRKRFVWQREFGAKNSQISQDFEKKRRMLWPRIAKKYW